MRFLAALSVFTSLLLAQGPPPGSGPNPNPPGRGPFVPGTGNPEMAPRIDQVKAALSLTDQQVTLLIQNRRDLRSALQPIHEQLAERQRTFMRSWQTENDPAVLGRILLDMRNLRAQAPEISARYNSQAKAILTPDQLPKLKVLEDAMKLRPAVDQAVQFGLVEQQGGPADFPLGLPGFIGRGGGGGRMMQRPLRVPRASAVPR